MKTNGAKWSGLRQNPRDEYYTRYEDLYVLDEWDFSDMIVYSPFDSEESAFVQYFKTHPVKEFIYTSDDYKNHRDLFEKADVIVSNPPFSEKQDIYRLCKETNTEMILILPTIPSLPYDPIHYTFYPFNRVTKFDSPYENKGVACQFFSTIGSKKHPYGWSFEEVFGKPLSIGKAYSELDGYPKYGKRYGFPDTPDAFGISSDNNCSEFEILKNKGMMGCIVKYRSML